MWILNQSKPMVHVEIKCWKRLTVTAHGNKLSEKWWILCTQDASAVSQRIYRGSVSLFACLWRDTALNTERQRRLEGRCLKCGMRKRATCTPSAAGSPWCGQQLWSALGHRLLLLTCNYSGVCRCGVFFFLFCLFYVLSKCHETWLRFLRFREKKVNFNWGNYIKLFL